MSVINVGLRGNYDRLALSLANLFICGFDLDVGSWADGLDMYWMMKLKMKIIRPS